MFWIKEIIIKNKREVDKMFSKTTLMEYIKTIVTNYTAALFIFFSIALFLFYKIELYQKEFPKETTIAKFGAILYAGVGIGLLIAKLFL